MFCQIIVFLKRRRPESVSPSAKFFHNDMLMMAPFGNSEMNTIRLPLKAANSGDAAPDIFLFPKIKDAETYRSNVYIGRVVCICARVCVGRVCACVCFSCRGGYVWCRWLCLVQVVMFGAI